MEFSKGVKQLKSEADWPIWKRKISDLFGYYDGALDVVNNLITKPEPLRENAKDSEVEAHRKKSEYYRKANCCAKSLITSTISDEVYQKVMDKASAYEMWDALHKLFEATSKDQLYKLCNDLFGYQWNNNQDVSTHVADLRRLWSEINSGFTNRKENTLPELLLVCKILNILPSEFSVFKSSWMMITRDEDKSLDELIMQLCLFERNMNSNEARSSHPEALVVNQKRAAKKHFTKSRDVCHYCKKKGHWLKDCRNWIADGRPTKNKLESINQTNVALHIVSSEVHAATTNDDWWIDNGATRHVTHSLEYFNNSKYRTLSKQLEMKNLRQWEREPLKY